MNDRIRKLLVRASSTASLSTLKGISYQEAILYAASDEIDGIEREKELALAEVKSLKARIEELEQLEQRGSMRTKLNLFRNIKFLNINKLINNEKD